MANQKKKFLPKKKIYHLILFGAILGSLYLLTSNNLTKQQSELKFRKLGYLDCYSTELIDYYRTGDLSKIDLSDVTLYYSNINNDNIKTLINIINNLIKKVIEKSKGDKGGGSIDEKELKKNIKAYFNHYILIRIFIIISFLSVIVWIICLFCLFCECCFCNFCKKESRLCSCFFFNIIIYALIIILNICNFSFININN